MQPIISQKLAAFDALEAECVACLQFVEAMHGQRRFPAVTVADSVLYLHALWVCECKDRLLSVPKTIRRYEGELCLNLLAQWQAGDSAGPVAFLHRKLDMVDFAAITSQLQTAWAQPNPVLARRLEHGRLIMLNRAINLHRAMDAIFALDDATLRQTVQAACARFGNTPDQIARQLAAWETSLYAFIPHHALVQRNITVMNKIGVSVLDQPEDDPGQRTWRVAAPTMPPGPFAQTPIGGYREMTAPQYNNLKHDRFTDRPEAPDAGVVVGHEEVPPLTP